MSALGHILLGFNVVILGVVPGGILLLAVWSNQATHTGSIFPAIVLVTFYWSLLIFILFLGFFGTHFLPNQSLGANFSVEFALFFTATKIPVNQIRKTR